MDAKEAADMNMQFHMPRNSYFQILFEVLALIQKFKSYSWLILAHLGPIWSASFQVSHPTVLGAQKQNDISMDEAIQAGRWRRWLDDVLGISGIFCARRLAMRKTIPSGYVKIAIENDHRWP